MPRLTHGGAKPPVELQDCRLGQDLLHQERAVDQISPMDMTHLYMSIDTPRVYDIWVWLKPMQVTQLTNLDRVRCCLWHAGKEGKVSSWDDLGLGDQSGGASNELVEVALERGDRGR